LGGLIGNRAPLPKTDLKGLNAAHGFVAANVAPPPEPVPQSVSVDGQMRSAGETQPVYRATEIGTGVPAQPSFEARSNDRLRSAASASTVERSDFNGPAEISLQERSSAPVARKALSSSAIGGPIRGGVLVVAQIVHWTISATGKLERRLSDGRFSFIEPAPGVPIRTVAAQGIEVWAAGSRPDLTAKHWQQQPMLFHSSDAGETWSKVDGPWQSPVTTLNLSATNILTVVTSDGSWTTADGGKSWMKK
jgi:hypothetical protein